MTTVCQHGVDHGTALYMISATRDHTHYADLVACDKHLTRALERATNARPGETLETLITVLSLTN